MADFGRNDPCPCGSGLKHKRCCLDLHQTALRLARDVHGRIQDLGEWVRDEYLDAWREAYERHLAPLNAFGGVPAEFADWLDNWLVCDARIVDGITAFEAAAALDPHPADEWLRASAISGWWLRGTGFPLPVSGWREEKRLTLHSELEPFGLASEGSLLVGRGVEIRPGHVALVGQPVVVDDAAVGDVLAVLATDPAEALCAALRWPEEREHTAQGELVQQCYRRYRLHDAEAAVTVMRALGDATEREDLIGYWEDDTTFTVAGAPTHGAAVEPPPERGVVWGLCEEDRADPPVLGEVTVSPTDQELAITAVTADRTDRLTMALPPRIHALLGELTSEILDAPDVLPRFSRDRLRELTAAP